ncbi:MAG TPA: hypothetical protein VH560_19815 [Polyangia bacterium]|nr:hypothetical protein [Polyangia bacterium]
MKTRWAVGLLLAGWARAASAADPPALPEAPPVLQAPPAPEVPPPDARGVVAPFAGTLTLLVPFAVGCALWSNSASLASQKAGTYVMASGFALAPIVSHGIAGRWRRAAVFGAASVATSTATLVAMNVKDPFDPQYLNRQRVPFGVLLTSALFAAAIGVFDSFVVGPTTRDVP